MNPPFRRLTRPLLGIVAAGMVTAVCLAPTTSARAAAVPTGECTTLGQVDTARVDLGTAIAEHRAAQAHRRAARAKYDAGPTLKRMQVLRAARAVVRTTLAARLTARNVYDVARSGYTACLPSVAVTNPRIAYYGSNFGIADITWSNVPDREYQYFLRYDGTAVDQGSVTFVDVIPPPPPITWPPTVSIRYLQNDVTYEGGYLGPGCNYTPGENISVELWTGTDGTNPAGLKVASATVDNPCR